MSEKSITVIAVTGRNIPEHEAAILRTFHAIPGKYDRQAVLVSPEPPEDDQITWHKNHPFNSSQEWSRYITNHLDQHFWTDFVILVQADGFALCPHHWHDEFLDYDYIGAPWPRSLFHLRPWWHWWGSRVGNGGFSLRSKKWVHTCATTPGWMNDPRRTFAEDMYFCRVRNAYMRRRGCRLAPLPVAMQWSYERPLPEHPEHEMGSAFGFHGWWNLSLTRGHSRNPLLSEL